MNFTQRVIDAVRNRTGRWGIGLASTYLRQIEPAKGHIADWPQLLKAAESRLVYSDDDTVIDQSAWLGRDSAPMVSAKLADGQTLEIKGARLKDADDPTPGAVMVIEPTVTTVRKDRDGDILRPKGARVDKLGPLLFNHLPTEPIGKLLEVLEQSDERIRTREAIVNNPLGRDVAQLIDFGALRRMSHGFIPDEDATEELVDEDKNFLGWDFGKYEMLERSVVSVASNVDAIITAFSREKLAHPLVKGWAQRLHDSRPVVVRGHSPAILLDAKSEGAKRKEESDSAVQIEDNCEICGERATTHTYTTHRFCDEHTPPCAKSMPRWNRRLSKAFDVGMEHLEPSKLEFDWVSRYLGCQVKELFQVCTMVPSARMGSWLTGLKHTTSDTEVDDVRAITRDGKEKPPLYEIIQLNSTLSDDFLVDGMSFHRAKAPVFIVKRAPFYSGLDVTVYTSLENKGEARKLIQETWDWAIENNFLKGEAFSLCGDFLPKSDELWGDLFLAPAVEKAIKQTVDRLNAKGRSAPNRGVLLMGPPGTGKTLSGRLIRNQADATFIWVSSRDFYYAGAFGGLMDAFSLARELAPSVLFIEDIDNWMTDTMVDLLKTELDGIGQSTGVVTVLTTNYPERLPEPLIDRPGRFHDVLMFELPDAKIREAMLRKWMPEAKEKDLRAAVKDTDGYSGAHLHELAKYARSLVDDDGVPWATALTTALRKIAEQRDLINHVQLEGSAFQPHRSVLAMCKTADAARSRRNGKPGEAASISTSRCIEVIKDLLRFGQHEGECTCKPVAQPPCELHAAAMAKRIAAAEDLVKQLSAIEKSGRSLSKANESRIEEARQDAREILNDGEVSRSVRALAASIASNLAEVLETLPGEEEEGKATTRGDVLAWLAGRATEEDWKSVISLRNGLTEQRRGAPFRRLRSLLGI